MPHRSRFNSVLPFTALREVFQEGYHFDHFIKDLLAGLTVGIIAIPLSMALAIASGVPPQYGLYTAIIAGILIPLTGGSRFSVSGPTAAFVVILYPVAQGYGLNGLLLATLLAGLIMLTLAFARLGRLIEYIPEPVTLGFTSGIAVVIAVLQLNDFLGLHIADMPEFFFAKLVTLFNHLPTIHTGELVVGLVTMASLILWPKFKTPIPTYLPAAMIGTLTAFFWGFNDVETIGTRFHYLLPDGTSGSGIPAVLPSLIWPWQQPGPNGVPLEWNLSLVIELLPAAFSIAMLGAIESLLCAVVLDGMSQKRHHSNGELLGQGIGNLVTPWFGGITATAALARSATNYRVGAVSPIAAIIHSLVVLAAILLLAPWLAKIPMATMAAMLLLVAWNMSEAPKAIKLIRQAHLGDVLVLLSCFSLTVIFDMVIAICAGVVLAALLFMRDIAQMTMVKDISGVRKHVPKPLCDETAVYKINGPLFFAAADRVFDQLEHLSQGKQKIILYLDGVSILDAGGLSALERFIERRIQDGCEIVLADLQFQPLKTVSRSDLTPLPNQLSFTATLAEALE